MSSLQAVIIADDLTGACDAAAQFLPQMQPIKVWVDIPSDISQDLYLYRVTSLNTQTRDLPAYSAGEICKAVGRRFRASCIVNAIFIKKIDTAFRGNVGIEIEQLLDNLGLKAALVIPSIPDLGRITINGVQLINGKPIHEFFEEGTSYKLKTSKVTELIKQSTGLPVVNLPLNTVRNGVELKHAVERVLKAGSRIIVFDAASNEDIDQIVQSLLPQRSSFLFVGSLGLTAAISRYLLIACNARPLIKRSSQVSRNNVKKGALVVCGSKHRVSAEQVEYLSKLQGVKVFSLRISQPGPSVGPINDIMAMLKASTTVVLRMEEDDKNIYEPSVAAKYLAQLTKAIAERIALEDIVILGGDTAYYVCKALGATELELEGLMYTVVSLGRVIKGPWQGLRMWLKGGSVGGPRILADIFGDEG